MEAYLNNFPPNITVDNITYRLVIFKNLNKETGLHNWTVMYECNDVRLVWRWNYRLYKALNLMESWLRKQGFWMEEKPIVDFTKIQ